MNITFDLLLTLVLAIYAQALFLEPPQFISHYLEREMLAVVRFFLKQDKDGGAFSSAKQHLNCFASAVSAQNAINRGTSPIVPKTGDATSSLTQGEPTQA